MSRLTRTSDLNSIQLRTVVAAPPEAVWAAFTDPEHLIRWFPLQASVVPGAGGNLQLAWDDIGSAWSISEWRPHDLLEVRQLAAFASKRNDPGVDADCQQSSGWRIRIEAISRFETLLDLEHFGFDDSSEVRSNVRRGWEFELFGLRYYLERHFGKDRSTIWVKKNVGCEIGCEFGIWESLALNPSGVPDRFEFENVEIVESPWHLVGTLKTPASSVFRLKLDRVDPDTVEVNVWLSAYDSAPQQEECLREELTRCLVEMESASSKESVVMGGRAR